MLLSQELCDSQDQAAEALLETGGEPTAQGAVLEAQVPQVLADPANHTADLGGSTSTTAFGDAVVAALS